MSAIKYVCKRDCYVGKRYRAGDFWEGDGVPPKHFALLESVVADCIADLAKFKGVDEALAQALVERGFHSREAVAAAEETPDGRARIIDIKGISHQMLQKWATAYRKEIAAANKPAGFAASLAAPEAPVESDIDDLDEAFAE